MNQIEHKQQETELAPPTVLPGRWFLPVGLKLAVGTLLVLLGVTALVVAEGLRQHQASLIASKRVAAERVTELFAAALVAPLDFRDPDGVVAEARRIQASRDVLGLGVWGVPADHALTGGEGLEAPAATDGPRAEIHAEFLDIVRPVVREDGRAVGSTRVRFSLESENQTYRQERWQILALAAALAALTSGALLWLARRQIVGPLRGLVEAARATEAGSTRVRVALRANDEIGQLGAAFNRMTAAIDDRERRLAEATVELQQVLDHMGQAIVVVDASGRIEGVHSREAERILGPDLPGQRLVDRLFPEARPSDIERRAFEQWLSYAPLVPDDEWDEVAALAPRELTLAGRDGEPRSLALDVRRLPVPGQASAMMLLISDITAQRKLERVVARQEAEHARELAVMRRLVAAGGHLFAAFLDDARARLAEADLARSSQLSAAEVAALLRGLHTLKGEARSFGLDALGEVVHDLESDVVRERSLPPPAPAAASGQSLRPGPVPPDERRARIVRGGQLLDEAERLFIEASPIGRLALEQVPVQRADVDALVGLVAGRDDAVAEAVGRLASRPFGEAVVSLSDGLPGWAEGVGKRVTLEVSGRDVPVPGPLARVLPGMLGHLVRNALVHSLETPAQRAEQGKPEVGTIRLSCVQVPGGVRVSIEDDGAGVDEERVRLRARSLGVDDSGPVGELLFVSGLSTADQRDLLAGRGVGLSAVRDECRKVGYEVTLVQPRTACFVLRPIDHEQRGQDPSHR